jgi:hypothetical protein
VSLVIAGIGEPVAGFAGGVDDAVVWDLPIQARTAEGRTTSWLPLQAGQVGYQIVEIRPGDLTLIGRHGSFPFQAAKAVEFRFAETVVADGTVQQLNGERIFVDTDAAYGSARRPRIRTGIRPAKLRRASE